MKIRHEIIRACRDFFDSRGFTQVDAPILINTGQKVQLPCLRPITAKKLIWHKPVRLYMEMRDGFRKGLLLWPNFPG